jgi:hypothetical protein
VDLTKVALQKRSLLDDEENPRSALVAKGQFAQRYKSGETTKANAGIIVAHTSIRVSDRRDSLWGSGTRLRLFVGCSGNSAIPSNKHLFDGTRRDSRSLFGGHAPLPLLRGSTSNGGSRRSLQ